MDIGKSFTYMFDDERWLNKVLIGGLIGLVPILNLALTGYMLRTLKNVRAGAARPMPEWDDLGNDWVKGLLVTVAGLVYALPLLIPFLPIVGLIVISGIAPDAGSGLSGAEAISNLLGLVSAGLWCLAVPYILLIAAWMPAATANYALAGDFAAFFRFGEIWGLIRRNAGNYALVVLIYIVASQIAGWVGALVLLVGAAFTGFWAQLVYAYLLGQFLREEPSAPAPVS